MSLRFLPALAAVLLTSAAHATGSFFVSLDTNGDLELWGNTASSSADTFDAWIALGPGSGVVMTGDVWFSVAAGYETTAAGFETIGGRKYLHIRGESSNGAESGSWRLATIDLNGSGCRDVNFYDPGGNESDFFHGTSPLNAALHNGSTCH